MQFTTAFLTLVLAAAPVFAAPAPISSGDLVARDTTVTCRPTRNESPTKAFIVDVQKAEAEARKAGFTGGKSGDPHAYGNGDHIVWGNNNCDKQGASHYEYPVFWKGSKTTEWEKDVKSKDQPKTPLRVVYVNNNGGIVYCGIMTHSEVDKDYQGKAFFEKCE